jgi:hypothetical protein
MSEQKQPTEDANTHKILERYRTPPDKAHVHGRDEEGKAGGCGCKDQENGDVWAWINRKLGDDASEEAHKGARSVTKALAAQHRDPNPGGRPEGDLTKPRRQPEGYTANHRDYNTGKPEPEVKVSAANRLGILNPANPTAIPADVAHLVPSDVKEGAKALEAVVAALSANPELGNGPVTIPVGPDGSTVTFQDASAGLSSHLQGLDASRLAVQGNGQGNLTAWPTYNLAQLHAQGQGGGKGGSR